MPTSDDIVKVTQPLGGLNEDDNPTSLREDELIVASNVFHRGTALYTRPGAVRDPDDFDARISTGGTDIIQGAFLHTRGLLEDFQGTRMIIAAVGGVVHTSDTLTLDKTGVQISDEADPDEGPARRWVMAQHQNTVWAAGGAPTDEFWYVASPTGGAPGTAITQLRLLDNAAAEVIPKLVFAKWNWLFAARFHDQATGTISVDSAANPMVARYHTLGTDPTVQANWATGNTVGGTGIGGFGGDFSEYITGFGDYADTNSDQLVIGTNKRLFFVIQTGNRIAPLRILDSAENGLVHQNAYVPLGLNGGDAVYMSRDGIHSVRQSIQHGNKANKFLSWKIRKTFESLRKDKLFWASGAYWPTEGVVLFCVPQQGYSSNSLILCLDVKGLAGEELNSETAIWSTWTLARDADDSDAQLNPALLFPARDSDDAPFVYCGTYRGDILRFATTQYADDGADNNSQKYEMKWQTKHRDFESLGQHKQFHRAYIKLVPGGDYGPKVTPVFDYGRREGNSEMLDMIPQRTSRWDTAIWDTDHWSSTGDEVTRKEWSPQGQGETIGLRMAHDGNNEPVGVAQLTFTVSGLGKDTGDI
jgi:hypothetical protein